MNERKSRKKNLAAISLYTGAGGLDLGFEAAGFNTMAAVELADIARETLRLNRPEWKQPDNGNALELSAEDLLSLAGMKVGEVDALIGGPPCQPFSKSAFWAAGTTRRLDDPRAKTLDAMIDLAGGILPKAVVIENVRGIAYRQKNEAVDLIEERFDAINRRHGTAYLPEVHYLHATDFGVPQIRERAFLIAFREGQAYSPPSPATTTARTAWDALVDCVPSDEEIEALMPTGKWAGLLSSIPEGENYQWHTEKGGGMPLFGWRTRYWSFLLKLAKDKPAWTIQADPGPATGPFHWDGRLLSSLEMARLQTFPADWKFAGDYRQTRRQIGNAVPPALAEAVGRSIATVLHGRAFPRGLSMAIASRGEPPPAIEPQPVPIGYRHLIGDHAAHPGTGKGPAASMRTNSPSDRRAEDGDTVPVDLSTEEEAAA